MHQSCFYLDFSSSNRLSFLITAGHPPCGHSLLCLCELLGSSCLNRTSQAPLQPLDDCPWLDWSLSWLPRLLTWGSETYYQGIHGGTWGQVWEKDSGWGRERSLVVLAFYAEAHDLGSGGTGFRMNEHFSKVCAEQDCGPKI